MRALLRVAIILSATIVGYFTAVVAPDVVARDILKLITALFTVVWAAHMYILPKLGELSGLEGLSETEQDRLVLLLREYRSRVWYIGGVCLLSSIAMILITARAATLSPTLVGAAMGFFLGLAMSYLGLAPLWSEEIHQFTDTVRTRLARRKRAEQLVKDMDGTPKPNGA